MKLALLAIKNSIHTIRWINALVERGHEVHLISSHDGGKDIDSRIQIHHLPVPPPLGYILNVPFLKRLLSKIKPDILHAHFASGYGTLGQLSRYHPYVLSVWGSDVYDFPYKSYIHQRLLLANLQGADKICSTSHAMAKQIKRLYPQINNIAVTPFGINAELFQPSREHEASKTSITIGTVKTLADKYGIDLLIQSFSKARQKLFVICPEKANDLRLVIIGDGSKKDELETLAKNQGIQDVTKFLGSVSHENISSCLNTFDIYVAMSRSESFGVAILEASACGVPVVVSDVGGLPEVVIDGETGFVVKSEDISAATEAILRLLLDATLRDKMGKSGRNYVVNNFEWEKNVDNMENIYATVIDNKN